MSKDKRWAIPSSSDQSILRKKPDLETDLLVFGYACKLFRDDQKALEMDQGKQLIPWMGDDTLKIDRYDARGHLYDLTPHEAKDKEFYLTQEERKIESMCDEERYRALNHNEEEQEMYQEEELKRLKDALSDKEYGQVAYKYADIPTTSTAEQEVGPNPEEVEEPFVPPPTLDIPPNMVTPTTAKDNQIIMKTAAYIAKQNQGTQVELVIKTRQSDNQKLSFLHINNPLNPYYHFILQQFKSGRLREGEPSQESSGSLQENEHYLHPSLAASTQVESAPSIPTIPNIAYKPSSNCLYSQLVSNIRNVQQREKEEEMVAKSTVSAPQKKKRKKKSNPVDNGTPVQFPQPEPKQATQLPPENIQQLISKLISFANSKNIHPSVLAAELVKTKNYTVAEFVQPDHKYHSYYLEQLQSLTFKENVNLMANPTVKEDNTSTGVPPASTGLPPVEFTATGVQAAENSEQEYDPEKPTDTDMDMATSSDPPNDPDYQGNDNAVAGSSCTPAEDQDVAQAPSKKPSTTTSQTQPQPDATQPYDVPNKPASARPSPVCFSIKKPKESERLEQVSAFPVEDSSGEDSADNAEGTDDADKAKQGENGKDVTLAKGDDIVKEKVVKEKVVKEKEKHSSRDNTTKESRGSSKSREKRVNGRVGSPSNEKPGTKDSRESKSNKKPKSGASSADGQSSSSKKGQSSKKTKGAVPKERSRKTTRSFKDHGRKKDDSKNKDKHHDRKRGKTKNDSKDKAPTKEDDMAPLLEESATFTPPLPAAQINDPEELKKREERKRKAKELTAMLKSQMSSLVTTNGTAPVQAPAASNIISELGISSSSTFLQNCPGSVPNDFLDKSQVGPNNSIKDDSTKDSEESRKQRIAQRLQKIAQTTLASIPPITAEEAAPAREELVIDLTNDNDSKLNIKQELPQARVSSTSSVEEPQGGRHHSRRGSRAASTSSPSNRRASKHAKSKRIKKHNKKKRKRNHREYSRERKRRRTSSSESSSMLGSSSDSDSDSSDSDSDSSSDNSSSSRRRRHTKHKKKSQRHKSHRSRDHKHRSRKHHRRSSSSD